MSEQLKPGQNEIDTAMEFFAHPEAPTDDCGNEDAWRHGSVMVAAFKAEREKFADLHRVLEAAKTVDDNDGMDEGWRLRYALRDYNATLAAKKT